MKLSLSAASMLALALFAVPAASQEQPTEPAVEQALPPADVVMLLEDRRALSELSDAELTQRIRKARSLVEAGGLDAETMQKLQALIKAARDERASRNLAQQQPAAEEQASQQSEAPPTETSQAEVPQAQTQPSATAEVPQDVQAFINEPKPLAEMSRNELRARLLQARQFTQANQGKPEIRKSLRAVMQSVRAELAKRSGVAAQPAEDGGTVVQPEPGTAAPIAEAPPLDAPDANTLDSNKASPEAEARARVFLTDPRPAELLTDAELRVRLNGMRELMAGNQLSRETERHLRRKLAAERVILRARIAAKQAGEAPQPGVVGGGTGSNELDRVLADRRPSGRLTDGELRRRIQVYRDAAFDVRYAESDRLRWRETIVQDRATLRLRLIEARRAREAELRARRSAGNIDIDIDIALRPGRPEYVDAAEVEDEEIEDFLVARPRGTIERRYTVDELEESPTLRDAVPRIEIDTIRFGFNEAFVREEEIESLDRIAEIMERILAAHPREVFVIEGHTDAVGSDQYNLQLSRQRARAVMQALTTYYVIPGENLRTVGYGERFLKIPTSEPEAENRRVAIARATALLGEANE